MSRSHTQFGFTLAEMMAAILIASVVSLVLLTGFTRVHYQTAQFRSRMDASGQLGQVLRVIEDELRVAMAVNSLTAASLSITVDRTADGQGIQQVAYQWLSASKTVTRTVNGGATEVILDTISLLQWNDQVSGTAGQGYLGAVQLTLQKEGYGKIVRFFELLNKPVYAR